MHRGKVRFISSALSALLFCAAIANAGIEKWEVRVVGSKGQAIDEISTADELLNGTLPSRFDVSAQLDTLNFNLRSPYRGGMAHHDSRFPGLSSKNQEDFALDASGWVQIPHAGVYTFDVNSDDGFQLQIGDNVASHVRQRHPHNSYATFMFSEAGIFKTDLTYFQHERFAELELFATEGTYQHFHQAGADFQLVGDTAAGGLSLGQPATVGSGNEVGTAVPEPGAIMILVGCGVVSIIRRRS